MACFSLLFCSQPFQGLKELLAGVHTVIVAPALASSELIKELQLLYSIIIVHVSKRIREIGGSLSGAPWPRAET